MTSLDALLPLAAIAMLVAAAGAALVWRVGGRLLVDRPRRHSSHAVPTPRGGGIGILLAVVATLAGIGASPFAPWWQGQVLPVALLLVGGVGLVDDWRGLPIAPRLLAHVVAAALVALHAVGPAWSPLGLALPLALPLTALALVWSINLHNFMDGSNGLLALQALFVCTTATAFALADGEARLALSAAVAGAAVLGFLPFNFPRARVFLGDVGSGAIGLLLGALLLLAMRRGTLPLAAGLALVSAFVLDATLTLLQRVLRRRRWHQRHREHLYQWLLRSGWDHPRVAGAWLAWNLLLALPVAWYAREASATRAGAAVAALYVFGASVWVGSRRRILAARRRSRS